MCYLDENASKTYRIEKNLCPRLFKSLRFDQNTNSKVTCWLKIYIRKMSRMGWLNTLITFKMISKIFWNKIRDLWAEAKTEQGGSLEAHQNDF